MAPTNLEFLSGHSLIYHSERGEILLARDEEVIPIIKGFPEDHKRYEIKLSPRQGKIYIQQMTEDNSVLSYLFGIDSLVQNPIERWEAVEPLITEQVEDTLVSEELVIFLLKELSESLSFLILDLRGDELGPLYAVTLPIGKFGNNRIASLSMIRDYVGVEVLDQESEEPMDQYFFRLDMCQQQLNGLDLEMIADSIQITDQQLYLIRKNSV